MSATLSRTEIPPHIDPSRVVDYDVFLDSRYRDAGDLHLALHQLAEEAGRGIFWTPRNGGHWLINDHELLFQAVRDPALFSSNNKASGDGAMILIPPLEGGGEPRYAPVSIDPPEHGAYRMPLMKAFAPAEMLKLEPEMRALITELISRIAARGRCEVVDALAEPFPVIMFMKLVGMPVERLAEFRGWIADLVTIDSERRAAAFATIDRAMTELVVERQAERRDDLISRLLDCEINGRPPTMVDMQSYCLLLFFAGLDTVVNALAYGMYHLASDVPLQQRLRADPALIPEFVEEVLRRYAVVMLPRIVARDDVFGGVQVREGERVLLMLPAGNLDPKVFPDPLTFDVDREDKAHMAFNSGPHRCVGSHLARLEMKVFFEEWLKAMPDVRLDPEAPPSYRAAFILTIAKLPIIWETHRQ